ncbi:MAG: hypothetical protein ACOYIS_03305, partial [Candidatus Cloacimonadaceae bacterium]|jgi:2-phosphoglycerate kinase
MIFLGGGSFQGKSLVAKKLAIDYSISAVITTDTIRNILLVQNPNDSCYSTSTYLMEPRELKSQMSEVSTLIKGIIPIYLSRGESVIFEGMHFTRELLSWAKRNRHLCVCMNSLIPLERRVLFKKVTRSVFHFIDDDGIEHFGNISEANLQESTYLKYRNRIEEITQEIVNNFASLDCPIVEYNDLDECLFMIGDIINKYYK